MIASKSGQNWNFQLLHGVNLYYAVGQKFARIGSMSNGFQDIYIFLFSIKIQDGS